MNKQVSIDWCSDSVTRKLPWDDSQFITVRRFTGAERRKRSTLAGTFRVGKETSEEMEIKMTYDLLKEYEWETSITDFRLTDGAGKVYLFSSKSKNKEIYDHLSGDIEKFIDDLVLEVNKEDQESQEEIEEVEKN